MANASPAEDPREHAPSNDIQVIARAAAILRLLSASESIDVVSAAKVLGIGRSSAHRYLASMEHHGLLTRRDRNSYQVGALMTQLGAVALARSGVIRAARPIMESLRDEMHQTVVMALWDGSTAVVAHVAEDTSRTAHVSIRVGRALLPDSAQATIFRAFAPGSYYRGAATEQLPTDPESEQIRRAGVVVRARQEDGIRAVAVPIKDPSGVVVATLAAVGIAHLVPENIDSDLATALTRSSAEVTKNLGLSKVTPEHG